MGTRGISSRLAGSPLRQRPGGDPSQPHVLVHAARGTVRGSLRVARARPVIPRAGPLALQPRAHVQFWLELDALVHPARPVPQVSVSDFLSGDHPDVRFLGPHGPLLPRALSRKVADGSALEWAAR